MTPIKTPQRPLSRDDLRDYFVSGCKQDSQRSVGIEWEKLGVDSVTGKAIAYSGARGVERILQELVRRFNWKPIVSKGHIIALDRQGQSITLEPGGQIELSGKKFSSLDDNAQELEQHMHEIHEVGKGLGVTWLGLGAQPFSIADQIEWVPKDRYAIMRQSLLGRGALVYSMMKETASVQISLDYTSVEDAVYKFRLAMALSPILSAFFANSPLREGVVTEFLSRRSDIWEHTDPLRTGILWQVFEPGFSLDHYVEFALGVPLLFIQRQNQWIRITKPLSFAQFMDEGYGNERANQADWELHLSSIFTEARFKTYIEFRSLDCQKHALGLAAAAFLKGLFYDSTACQKAWRLLSGFSVPERKLLKSQASRMGLRAKLGNQTVLSLAEALLALAREGLKEEAFYLAPMEEIVALGLCPASQLLKQLEGARTQEEIKSRTLKLCAI